MTPPLGTVAWISDESLRRLKRGGNDSKGTVPVHAKKSSVSKHALFCAITPLTKSQILRAGGVVHSDGHIVFKNMDDLSGAILHALEQVEDQMKTTHHKSVTVYVHGVEVEARGVTFYPYVPANETAPPEEPFVDFEEVFIGDQDAGELFYGKQLEELNSAILTYLEQ